MHWWQCAWTHACARPASPPRSAGFELPFSLLRWPHTPLPMLLHTHDYNSCNILHGHCNAAPSLTLIIAGGMDTGALPQFSCHDGTDAKAAHSNADGARNYSLWPQQCNIMPPQCSGVGAAIFVRLRGGGANSKRRCNICALNLPESDFANNQLKKKRGTVKNNVTTRPGTQPKQTQTQRAEPADRTDSQTHQPTRQNGHRRHSNNLTICKGRPNRHLYAGLIPLHPRPLYPSKVIMPTPVQRLHRRST